mgnify:CR=1 FL=1
MFLILTMIVLVAALNITSMLIMIVMEKTKDIGILRSLGATRGSVAASCWWRKPMRATVLFFDCHRPSWR